MINKKTQIRKNRHSKNYLTTPMIIKTHQPSATRKDNRAKDQVAFLRQCNTMHAQRATTGTSQCFQT